MDGESTSDWYGRVRVAATPCRFGSRRLVDAAVADKFVTGLRPGPAADRLLGERADGRPPDDLLAVAMDAEKAAVQEAAPPSKFTSSSITPPPATSDALADIREALKLYQYSGDEYTVGLSAGADHEELTEVYTNQLGICGLRLGNGSADFYPITKVNFSKT